jgi:hypothetical protein
MIWRLLCILIISTSSSYSSAENSSSIVLKSEYLSKEQAQLAANRLFWQAISEGLVDGQAIIRYLNKDENNNHAVHYNLLLVYTKQAKFGLAKQHLEKSLILKPLAFKQKNFN